MDKARRNTRQLEVIWKAIKDETSHPTADQVYEMVREVTPKISLGTVYRNLQKLVAEGKLQVLTLGRTQHFDPLVRSHHHFICQSCQTVYDISVDSKDYVLPFSFPEKGFTVNSHELTLHGTCKSCSG
ncbi:MAG: transcriptional repressor [Deltaproteobacteria bacterium]|nr:transcriptional repressor [Deltaproteobacteria bacterium]